MERAQLQYCSKGDWSNCKNRKEKWKVPYFEVDLVVTASFSFSWRLKVASDELNSMSSLPLCSAQYWLPFDMKFLHGWFFLVLAMHFSWTALSTSHLITFLYSTTKCLLVSVVCCVVPRVDLEDLSQNLLFLSCCCVVSSPQVIHHLELALLHLLALLYFLGRVSGMGMVSDSAPKK